MARSETAIDVAHLKEIDSDDASGPIPATTIPASSTTPWRRLRTLFRWDPLYGTALDRAADRQRARVFWSVGAGAAAIFALASALLADAGLFAHTSAAPRIGLVGVFLTGLLLAHRTSPGTHDLRRVDTGVYSSASAFVGLLTASDGGLTSPLAHLMPCLIVAQGITLRDDRQRRGVRLLLSTAAFAGAFFLGVLLRVGRLTAPQRPAQPLGDLAEILLLLGLLSIIVLAAPSVVDARPKSAGRYLLEKRIGDGGMAEVWLGHGPASPEAVAVKVMRPARRDPQAIMRFGREVAALAELRHESTIRVLDWGVASGTFYYVMELLSGETLHALVRREGPLPPERAIPIVREVARAISEAHGHGIVHRDIKPENIYVLPGDRVKVLDFGVAKLPVTEQTAESSITRVGTAIGTPSYMAPEQIMADPVDARTDIYGLGATLFFALTGRPPFSGTPVEIFRAHLRSEIPDVTEHSAHPISPQLRAVVVRCLQKAASKRFASMNALDAALTAALEGTSPANSQPPGATSEPPTPRVVRLRRRSSARRTSVSSLAPDPMPTTVRGKRGPAATSVVRSVANDVTIGDSPSPEEIPATAR